MNDLQAQKREIRQQLLGCYTPEEAESVARQLIEEGTGRRYPELLLTGYKLTEKRRVELKIAMARLLQGEPLQQVVGHTYFGDLVLQVNKDTLIPRPETEELCEKILTKVDQGRVQRGLDIGTGSGAIALYLKKALPHTEWHALDVSTHALEAAQTNSQKLGLSVHFHHMDIFKYNLDLEFDLVVSNPPYILPSEKRDMEKRVLDYEPHGALFVPESDPILFYREIFNRLLPYVRTGGLFAFELNPLTAKHVLALFHEKAGTFQTQLETDIFGRTRFLFAKRLA